MSHGQLVCHILRELQFTETQKIFANIFSPNSECDKRSSSEILQQMNYDIISQLATGAESVIMLLSSFR